MQQKQVEHKRKRSYKLSKLPTTDADLIWECRYCCQENSVWIDLTIPGKQDFTEDCSVCCRPNRLIVSWDFEGEILLETRFTDE